MVLLALMHWWTSRGVWPTSERDENYKLLRLTQQWWGKRVIHVFDQGYAGGPWLGALFHFQVRFVMRWKKSYHLLSPERVKQPPWHFGRGKKGQAPR